MQSPDQLTHSPEELTSQNNLVHIDNKQTQVNPRPLKKAVKILSLELLIFIFVIVALLFGLNYLRIIKLESIFITSPKVSFEKSKTTQSKESVAMENVEKKDNIILESKKIADLKPGQYVTQVNVEKTRAIVMYPEVSNEYALQGFAYSVLPSCTECMGYDKIDKAYFLPETDDLILIAIKNGEYYVKHGSKEWGPYQPIGQVTEYASPVRSIAFGKGGHYAYSVINNGNYMIYKDDALVGTYEKAEEITEIKFSPDGSKFAYTVFIRDDQRNKSYTVLDSKKGKEYPGQITGLKFTSDSKHFIYIADKINEPERRGPDKTVVFDENTYHSGNDLLPLGWGFGDQIMTSSDGGYAYVLVNHFGDYKLIVNNKIIATAFQIENFSFSPDGKRFAYITIDKASYGKESVYQDGKKIFEIAARHNMGVTHLRFGTDSKHLYFVVDGQKIMKDGVKVIREETRGGVDNYSVSLDQTRLIYSYYDSHEKILKAYVDGTDYALYGRDLLFLSPEHNHFFIWTTSSPSDVNPFSGDVYSRGQAQLVVNGSVRPTLYEVPANPYIEGDTGQGVHGAKLSSDGKHFSFTAKKGNELWYIVEKLNQ